MPGYRQGSEGIRHGPPRQAPYPQSVKIDGYTYPLGQAKPGEEFQIYQAPDQSAVTPQTYGYGADAPLDEQTYQWKDIFLGVGLATQVDPSNDHRIRYAEAGDTSTGQFLKGPQLSTIGTPAANDPKSVGRIAEHLGKIYIGMGRYVASRTNDTTLGAEIDFGAGNAVTDFLAFTSNNAAAVDTLYVAAGGAAANPFIRRHTLAAGWETHGSLRANCFATAGGEFYIADLVNRVRKPTTITDDPWVAAVFTTYTIGDQTSPVTRMMPAPDGTLMIMKTDGIYSLDASGNVVNLFTQFKSATDVNNGQCTGTFMNSLFTTYNDNMLKITPIYVGRESFIAEPWGLESLPNNNDSPIQGRFTAFAGHGTFHAYGCIKTPSGDGYIMKLARPTGQDITAIQGPVSWHGEEPQSWHGSVTTLTSAYYGVAMLKSTVGAASGHSRMYILNSDSSLQYITLPCTANPYQCTAYNVTTDDSNFYMPHWRGLFGSELKAIRGITFVGYNLSASQYGQFSWKLDPTTASWSTFLTPTTFTGLRSRNNIPSGTSTTIFDAKITLHGGGGLASTAQPYLESVALHTALWRTPTHYRVKFLCLTSDHIVLQSGAILKRGVKQQRAHLRAAKEKLQVQVYFPDRVLHNVRFQTYQETLGFDQLSQDWRAAVELTGYDEGEVANNGAYSRLEATTYGILEGHAYVALESF